MRHWSVLLSLGLAGLTAFAQTPLDTPTDPEPEPAPPAVAAQPSPQPGNPATRFLRDVTADQKRIWTSPFHMTQRQFWTIAVPLVGGTVGLKALDRRISDSLPNTADQILWSGRVSRIGSGYGLAVGAGVTTLVGHYGHEPAATSMGRAGVEALASGLLVTYATKWVFWRERPDAPGGRGSLWSGGSSFPSGHTLSSFAVATAIAQNRKCPKWVAVTLYGVATAVSLSRVSSRRHFSADIYFGAFSGILIGRSVARAAENR
ncbi:phosphatase PAP2 family protein [Paludibaculum fermentans]|uniref:Phosphatase PAP2 family protein n=1 Tax=Paludibaculum fermentans TaxID=1473598 RepID=A0A7S7NYD3_PALFE|nr:phosphatase PAP2 family protein [Paludibaculum fermentans]QOY91484.1 phosphatase PAP2 family protein [Paludibaculum fermentans]